MSNDVYKGEIVSVSGAHEDKEAVCIHRVGDIGVTREHGVDYWVLTDLPSGVCAGFAFDYPNCAINAANQIHATVDWKDAVKEMAAGKRPASSKKIVDILLDNGGEKTHGQRASAEKLTELRHNKG